MASTKVCSEIAHLHAQGKFFIIAECTQKSQKKSRQCPENIFLQLQQLCSMYFWLPYPKKPPCIVLIFSAHTCIHPLLGINLLSFINVLVGYTTIFQIASVSRPVIFSSIDNKKKALSLVCDESVLTVYNQWIINSSHMAYPTLVCSVLGNAINGFINERHTDTLCNDLTFYYLCQPQCVVWYHGFWRKKTIKQFSFFLFNRQLTYFICNLLVYLFTKVIMLGEGSC